MSLKKFLFFGVILASILIINSLIHSIYALWQKNRLILTAKQELKKQEEENKELKKRLTEVKKSEFIEKEARNKLFLGKEGEGVVILPTDYLKASDSGKKQPDARPNWRKWWDLFFTKAR